MRGRCWRRRSPGRWTPRSATGRPLRGVGHGEWLERLEAEAGNLAAAVEWYLAHDPGPLPHLFRALWPFWLLRARSPNWRSRRVTQSGAAGGAAEGLRRRVGSRTWPMLRRGEAELANQLRQALEADHLDKAFAAGARLNQREAVAAVHDRPGTTAPEPRPGPQSVRTPLGQP